MELKTGTKERILITVSVAILLVVIFYMITSAITKYTGYFVSSEDRNDDIKNCLEEKDITLYINTKDVAETLEKIELNEYLKFFSIKNCMIDNSYCLDENISVFPTWIIEGNKIEREINREELSQYSSCKLSE